MLYHGPVRAPANAAKGQAVVRVEMPKDSKFKSFPTDIPVVIQ